MPVMLAGRSSDAGTVSFAIIFVANHPHPKKYRDPSDVSNAAQVC